jgi:hypothetical protein
MADRAYTTRRSILKAAVAAPAFVAVAATGLSSPGTAEPTTAADLAGYYAFLWMEMELIEQELGIGRLDNRTFWVGEASALKLQEGVTPNQRRQWLEGYARSRKMFL